MQQKPTSSTQTSHQQMAGPSMNASSSSTSQSNQNQDDHYHYTTSSDTQLTDTQQMTSAAITSAASQQHISQNGYATSISNTSVQSTPSFNQSPSIGGAQTAWRGSSTVTYTPSPSMQPDSRPMNQQFCESLSNCFSRNVHVLFSFANSIHASKGLPCRQM